MKRTSLPYLNCFKDRHGKWRARFRRGTFSRYLKGEIGSPEFLASYNTAQLECGGVVEAPKSKPALTVERAMLQWRVAEWSNLKAQTKRDYEATLKPWLEEYGDIALAEIERANIRGHLSRRAGAKAQANKCRKRLRAFFAFAVAEGWIAADPTAGVKGFKLDSAGYHDWTEAEIAQFEAHWPRGSAPRLAFALALFTLQRRGDVAAWPKTDVFPPKMRVRQEKTGELLVLPIHPELIRTIEASPAHDAPTVLATQWGSHSLKKGSAIASENGATRLS